MNIRRDNVCPGSGMTAGVADMSGGRRYCHRCGRSAIRVRLDGRFYLHAKQRVR